MDSKIRQRLHEFTKQALSREVTVHNSYLLAEQCIRENISGDFVECGVFAGAQVAAMALANQCNNGNRKVHLFDSFVGIPQAGPNDDKTITGCIGEGDGKGTLISTGVSAQSTGQVQYRMREWNIDETQLIYHKGWFQVTVLRAVELGLVKKIAVLRLDGDLYESTKVCLKYLHPLVSKGGFVIVDDYILTGCKKAMCEYWQQKGLTIKPTKILGGGGPVYYCIK